MPTLHHFLTQLKSCAWDDNALVAWIRDTRHMRKFVQGMDIAPSGTGSQRQIGVAMRGESNIPPMSVQAAREQLKAVDGPIGVQTPFNVSAFPKWSRRPAADLTREQSVNSGLEAVESGTPIAFLNQPSRIARASQERLGHA